MTPASHFPGQSYLLGDPRLRTEGDGVAGRADARPLGVAPGWYASSDGILYLPGASPSEAAQVVYELEHLCRSCGVNPVPEDASDNICDGCAEDANSQLDGHR